jgi:hypothetical protein
MSKLTFKDKLKQLIVDDTLKSDDIMEFIGEFKSVLGNPKFMNGFKQLADIICKDRDGIIGFTINDIKVLQKALSNGDIIIISQLVNGIVLLISSLGSVSVDLKQKQAEELVLKILLYSIFVELPKRVGGLQKITTDDKLLLLNIIVALYDSIRNAQSLEEALKYFKDLMKNGTLTRLCPCIFKPKNTNKIVAHEMTKIRMNLNAAIMQTQNIVILEEHITNLEHQFATIQANN